MPSPVLNVVSGGDEESPPQRNGMAASPITPPSNADGSSLSAPLRRASSSTPPLLQRPLSYSIQLPPSFAAGAAAAAASNPVTQQLPPACGARQLSKLKRFLTTLMQFGDDISSEVGDQVRSLILALVNSAISTEEFHSKLQETTNFPLRPFVIPFLKTNLPFLQRELLQCARLSSQYPDRYLNLPSSNAVPPLPHLSSHHSLDSLGPPPTKRPAPLLLHSSLAPPPPLPPQEQHIPPFHGYPLHRRPIPTTQETLPRNGGLLPPRRGGDDDIDAPSSSSVASPRAGNTIIGSSSSAMATAEAMIGDGDADSPTPHPFEQNLARRREVEEGRVEEEEIVRIEDPNPAMEREIYYVYHLLSTVSVMMEKARLSLESIKSRNSSLDGGGDGKAACPDGNVDHRRVEAAAAVVVDDSPVKGEVVGGSASTASTTSTSSSSSETAQDLSSYSSSNREAETREAESTDNSLEVVVNAEAAAVPASLTSSPPPPPPRRTKWSGKIIAEVEGAIDDVEAKTAELIADADLQRTKLFKRKLRQDDVDDEEESLEGRSRSTAAVGGGGSISSSALKTSLEMMATESEESALFCWNCGREANDTCSGCNKAKYCGSFCQHKDWENHHATCAQLLKTVEGSLEPSRKKSTGDPPPKDEDEVGK